MMCLFLSIIADLAGRVVASRASQWGLVGTRRPFRFDDPRPHVELPPDRAFGRLSLSGAHQAAHSKLLSVSASIHPLSQQFLHGMSKADAFGLYFSCLAGAGLVLVVLTAFCTLLTPIGLITRYGVRDVGTTLPITALGHRPATASEIQASSLSDLTPSRHPY